MKYLYFCTNNELDSILREGRIKRVKENIKFSAKDYQVYTEQNRKIVAYAYNIEMISESKCYATFPYDYLGKTLVRRWNFLFGFIPYRATFCCHNLPHDGRAIVFDIENEADIEHHYLRDRMIPGKMYCESFSVKPIRIKNVQEMDLNEAFTLIGLKPPYYSFPFQHYVDTRILISPKFVIGT